MALISKITVCMNVHILRHGMLASKGHSVSLPQRMTIACNLPKLPSDIGIVVVRKKGSNTKSKEYTVKRDVVQNALEGLCFGYPNGGAESSAPGLNRYDGPDHIDKALNGRYFEHFPNPFYKDVNIIY